MNEQTDIVPQNENEADQLLENLSESHDERTTEPGAQAPEAEKTPQQQAIEEFSLKVGGKEIKATRDKLLRWAEQGYDAPNRIGELNKKLEAYVQKDSHFKEMEERYGPVDKYLKENPQMWNIIQQTYQQQMQQQQQQNGPVNPMVQQLAERLEKIEGIAQTYEQRQAEIRMQQEDTALVEEVQTLQKKYPEIDFETPDASGKSLEYKVLEHANANGIKKFTTAFKDFYHDELLKSAEEKAKEKVINERQSKSKLGILGISTTPTRKTSDSVKGKSWNDLEREALQELGIG